MSGSPHSDQDMIKYSKLGGLAVALGLRLHCSFALLLQH